MNFGKLLIVFITLSFVSANIVFGQSIISLKSLKGLQSNISIKKYKSFYFRGILKKNYGFNKIKKRIHSNCSIVAKYEKRVIISHAKGKICYPRYVVNNKIFKSIDLSSDFSIFSNDDVNGDVSGEKPCQKVQSTEVDERTFDFLSCWKKDQCDSSGKSVNWPQKAMGLDKAIKLLKKRGINLNNQKVAVIDSGIDSKLAKQYYPNTEISVLSMNPSEVGSIDKVGHGTAVSSVILGNESGSDRINPTLSSYAIHVNEEGGIPGGAIELAIERACDEGNTIINVSAQGIWNEVLTDRTILDDKPELLQKLESKGCLVIQSAGNRKSIIKDVKEVAPLITVGSVSPISGFSSKFSATGLISAPGEGVLSLISSDASSLKEGECSNKQDWGFMNGTSFSSPLVAKTTLLAKAALEASPKYNTLEPVEKVRILKSVLKASQVSTGFVNSYLAVKLAIELLTLESAFKDVDISLDLAHKKIKQNSNCSKEQEFKCLNNLSCLDFQTCEGQLIDRIFVCGDTDQKARTAFANMLVDTERLEELSMVGTDSISKDKFDNALLKYFLNNLDTIGSTDDFPSYLSYVSLMYRDTTPPKELVGKIRVRFKKLLESLNGKKEFTEKELGPILKIFIDSFELEVINTDIVMDMVDNHSDKIPMVILIAALDEAKKAELPGLADALLRKFKTIKGDKQKTIVVQNILKEIVPLMTSNEYEKYYDELKSAGFTKQSHQLFISGIWGSKLPVESKVDKLVEYFNSSTSTVDGGFDIMFRLVLLKAATINPDNKLGLKSDFSIEQLDRIRKAAGDSGLVDDYLDMYDAR